MTFMCVCLLLLVLFNAVPCASSKPLPKSRTSLINSINDTDNDAFENYANYIEDQDPIGVGNKVFDSDFSAKVAKEIKDNKEEENKNIVKNKIIDVSSEKAVEIGSNVSVSDSKVEVNNSNSGTEEDFATTNVQLESTEEYKSEDVSASFDTSSLIEHAMKDFRDIKAHIEIREGHLGDLLITNAGNKELLQIENLLIELEDKVIVPYEMQLKKKFSEQHNDSKYHLDNDALNYIKSADKFLQSSRDRLDEVDKKIARFTSNNREVTAETNSYEEFLKEKIASNHIKAHEQEYDASEDVLDASSSLYKFLVPGLTLLAFILFCLLVVYKITKKKNKTEVLISKRVVGYTGLNVKVDEDDWNPRNGGSRYQKFK